MKGKWTVFLSGLLIGVLLLSFSVGQAQNSGVSVANVEQLAAALANDMAEDIIISADLTLNEEFCLSQPQETLTVAAGVTITVAENGSLDSGYAEGRLINRGTIIVEPGGSLCFRQSPNGQEAAAETAYVDINYGTITVQNGGYFRAAGQNRGQITVTDGGRLECWRRWDNFGSLVLAPGSQGMLGPGGRLTLQAGGTMTVDGLLQIGQPDDWQGGWLHNANAGPGGNVSGSGQISSRNIHAVLSCDLSDFAGFSCPMADVYGQADLLTAQSLLCFHTLLTLDSPLLFSEKWLVLDEQGSGLDPDGAAPLLDDCCLCYTLRQEGSQVGRIRIDPAGGAWQDFIPWNSAYEQAWQLPPAPTRGGFVFGGWQLSDDSIREPGAYIAVSGSMTATALWLPVNERSVSSQQQLEQALSCGETLTAIHVSGSFTIDRDLRATDRAGRLNNLTIYIDSDARVTIKSGGQLGLDRYSWQQLSACRARFIIAAGAVVTLIEDGRLEAVSENRGSVIVNDHSWCG